MNSFREISKMNQPQLLQCRDQQSKVRKSRMEWVWAKKTSCWCGTARESIRREKILIKKKIGNFAKAKILRELSWGREGGGRRQTTLSRAKVVSSWVSQGRRVWGERTKADSRRFLKISSPHKSHSVNSRTPVDLSSAPLGSNLSTPERLDFPPQISSAPSQLNSRTVVSVTCGNSEQKRIKTKRNCHEN